ncbi:UDP-N-acetylglucosamine 2-epimerase [Brevibacillus sp. NRS-1366]|uniref:UDP-N-acetylglucosamine 2-epimerase n=1 Tax=Brevibacillus sp. NRS-1366 TaxID=3233899 RepID=UPI003D18FF74
MLCITGTRADYGIFRPLLFEINKDAAFSLQLVATGMHLVADYGYTLEGIRKDPFPIIATPSILLKGDSLYAMSQSVGMGIVYFSDIFHYHKPDVLLILGDRGEMLAAAIAAHYQNIRIVHLHGGEISGSADDAVRHAVSKLAHLHFVSTLQAKRNLVMLGEEEWRVVPVGSLQKREIERIRHLAEEEKQLLIDKYQLASMGKKILLAMHPDSKDPLSFESQIGAVLEALGEIGDGGIIIIGPNSDAGGDLFRERLLAYAGQGRHCHYFSSIPVEEYLFLLSQADVMIGNSSSGIIEAPFFGLPFVNVGDRQKGRDQGDNVVNVPYQADVIREAICLSLKESNRKKGKNPYELFDSPELEVVRQLKRLVNMPDVLHKKLVTWPD